MALAKSLTGPTRINSLITEAAQRYGVDPTAMRTIAHLESRGNPGAKNPKSSAGGLFQFIDSTAKGYGLQNRFDPAEASDAAARLARDNAQGLRSVLGRDPTAGELYLAHQQGLGGARKLLSQPNARAVDVVGRDQVILNGGDPDMTALEFANLWMGKADRLAGSGGGETSGGGSQSGAPMAGFVPAMGNDTMTGSDAGDTLDEPDQSPVTLDDIFNAIQAQGTAPDTSVADAYNEGTPDLEAIYQAVQASGMSEPWVQNEGGPMTPTLYGEQGQAAEPDFFDITQDVTQPARDLLSATGESIMGRGPSVAGQMLPEGMPGRENVGRFLDIGLAPLGAAGLGYAGAVGVGSDLAEAAGMRSAPRLARDLMAAPDALAGSPGQFMTTAGRAGRAAPDQPGSPARVEPPVSKRQSARRITEEQFAALPEKKQREKLGGLLVKAGRGDRAAQDEIVGLAKIDPEAAAAAERLGINVPVDVLGDNFRLDEVAGMLRTAKGLDASAEWEATVRQASERAYDIMRNQGQYENIASVSDDVRRTLQDGVQQLDDAAGPIFSKIKNDIPKGTRAKPNNMVKALNEIIEDVGGVKELLKNRSFRQIYEAVTDGDGITYGRLEMLRSDLGKARFQGAGPYADANDRISGMLYGAARQDMLDHVEAVSGAGAKADLERAFSLKSASHDMRGALKEGFGKNHDGSIASLLTRSVTQASRGDAANLTKAMRVVPKDMRKDALLAAFDELSSAKSGANAGAFSFQQFQKLWGGVEKQTPVMAMMREELGKDGFNALRDLAKVSQKMQRALDQTQAAKKTGASLTAEYFADGILTRVMNGRVGNTVTSMAGGMAAGAAGGPLAAAGAQAGLSSMRLGGKRAQVASQLFSSDAFQKLAVEAARTGQVSAPTIRSVEQTQAFKNYARANGITNPNNWLAGIIASSQAQAQQRGQQNDQ